MTEDNNAKAHGVVTVRRYKPDDGPIVAKIWLDGLQQTIDESWWIFQGLFRYLFDIESKKVLSNDGDIGPDGVNIQEFWIDQQNSEFLVATINDKVVGCVGLKVGTTSLEKGNEKEDNTTSSIDKELVSVWRLSVDENFRRMGAASKLMEACHDWAKGQGAKQMTLNTGNPVASKFYLKLGYEYETWYSIGTLIKNL